MVRAKKLVIAKKYQGEPKVTDFRHEEEDIPPLKNNEFLAEAEWFSVDPYMRPYSSGMPVGTTMIGGQVAKVIESKHPKYPVGCYVVGYYGWRTHTVVSPDTEKVAGATLLPTYKLPDLKLPLSTGLGVVGMPGFTAYFGFLELCQPKPGDVVVVSTAAGAVGSIVGQIAKIKGCTVIGYTGSDKKVQWLKELGFDHAYNYKTVNLTNSLKEAAPNGVDCYFDNVGGTFSGEVLSHMRQFGRIAVCGAISTYNNRAGEITMAPAVQGLFIGKQLRMEGFLVPRWVDRIDEAATELGKWVNERKLAYTEAIYEGFAELPAAFASLFTGENSGKTVVKA